MFKNLKSSDLDSHQQWFDERLRIPRPSLVPASTSFSVPIRRQNLEEQRTPEAKTIGNFLNHLKVTKNREQSDVGRHKMASGSNLLTAGNLAQMNKQQDLALKAKNGAISHSSANNTLNNESDSNLHISQSINLCNVSVIENQLDALSVASSTHFTMINGFGVANNKADDGRGCCCCKPIAAVIITMTGLLFLIIFGAICFAEYPRMMASIK